MSPALARTGVTQLDEFGTAPDQEMPHLHRPRVIERVDTVQAGTTSQSRRVAGATSSSYWGPAEISLSGSPARIDDAAPSFQLVQAWNGIVTRVSDETLVVRIVPMDGVGLEEEAEFLLSDIPEEDRQLVHVGAPLFWFLGYETARGRRRRTSELKMRRVSATRVPSDHWLESVQAIIASPDESEPTEG